MHMMTVHAVELALLHVTASIFAAAAGHEIPSSRARSLSLADDRRLSHIEGMFKPSRPEQWQNYLENSSHVVRGLISGNYRQSNIDISVNQLVTSQI